MKIKRISILILIISMVTGLFADEKISIAGTVEWDSMEIKASVSLDLASTGLRLPSGRTLGEVYLNSGYLRLMCPNILSLQADSSSTIADLVDRGELNLYEVEAFALSASAVPPALSQDMLFMTSSYTMSVSGISSALLRHSRVTEVPRTLTPVSTAGYTGIIIIAVDYLPVHGMRSAALAQPCLFPKIWDSEMNLLYERTMLEARNRPMVHYTVESEIFQSNPSGVSDDLQKIVGDRPLRIFATGVFGMSPTDLIIDVNDAMLIISSDVNRRLLSEGKVAVILNESVLKQEFRFDE